MTQEFMLQDGEQIVQDIVPMKNLLYKWTLGSVIGFFFLILFLGGWFIIPLLMMLGPLIGLVLSAILLFVLPLIIAFPVSYLKYKKRHYWITNERIIFKSGFIGYQINSIPLERISDVLVTRKLLERIFGFGSVHTQTLAGQMSTGKPMGAEANLEAVPNPEELQKLIFQLIKNKRKTQGITM
jgi:uncharacterized membrane protein YdbT with pleckstrin-like domain